MTAYRVQEAAGRRIDEIYRFTRETWGEAQADRYIRGLFAKFDDIAARRIPWRAVPAEIGVEGFIAATSTTTFIGVFYPMGASAS